MQHCPPKDVAAQRLRTAHLDLLTQFTDGVPSPERQTGGRIGSPKGAYDPKHTLLKYTLKCLNHHFAVEIILVLTVFF